MLDLRSFKYAILKTVMLVKILIWSLLKLVNWLNVFFFRICTVREFTIIYIHFTGKNSETDGRCEPSGGQTSRLVQREESAAGARKASANSQG